MDFDRGLGLGSNSSSRRTWITESLKELVKSLFLFWAFDHSQKNVLHNCDTLGEFSTRVDKPTNFSEHLINWSLRKEQVISFTLLHPDQLNDFVEATSTELPLVQELFALKVLISDLPNVHLVWRGHWNEDDQHVRAIQTEESLNLIWSDLTERISRFLIPLSDGTLYWTLVVSPTTTKVSQFSSRGISSETDVKSPIDECVEEYTRSRNVPNAGIIKIKRMNSSQARVLVDTSTHRFQLPVFSRDD